MTPKRRLVLRRETLAELGSAQLREVAGGTHIVTDCGCLTHGYSCDDCPVPSLPINTCVCTTLRPHIGCAAESLGGC